MQRRRPQFDSWVGKLPWESERLSTPVFWPREFHGLYNPWGRTQRVGHNWVRDTEESFISPCYSLELCIQMGISFLSPLPLASLLFSGICKSSSDKHFDFLHFFFLGMVCAVSQTSVHSPSGALSIRSNPFRRSLYQIWSLQALSLSLSIRSDPFRRSLYQIWSLQAHSLSDLIPWICLSLALYNRKGFHF